MMSVVSRALSKMKHTGNSADIIVAYSILDGSAYL
jgi:hypothetical protein